MQPPAAHGVRDAKVHKHEENDQNLVYGAHVFVALLALPRRLSPTHSGGTLESAHTGRHRPFMLARGVPAMLERVQVLSACSRTLKPRRVTPRNQVGASYGSDHPVGHYPQAIRGPAEVEWSTRSIRNPRT